MKRSIIRFSHSEDSIYEVPSDQLNKIKNILMKSIIVVLFAISLLGASCTKDFEETNVDPNFIDQLKPGTLLNPLIYDATWFNMPRSDDFTAEIMQVSLPFPGGGSGGVHHYDFSDLVGNSTWNTYYKALINIREMQKASVDAGDPAYEGVAMILHAWVVSNLTDCFGDVPMSEASQAEEGIRKPKFDTQQEIYTALLNDLDVANQKLNGSRMIYATDILYANNVANWRKFGNSLKLRLLLRVSKRPEMDAFNRMATIFNNPTQYPIITKNEESAILKISGVSPNKSPWERASDFTTGQAAASFFVEKLVALNDPRLPKFVTKARDKITGAELSYYQGIPSGYAGNDDQFTYTPSNKVQALVIAPMIAPILTYAEVELIRTELIQRGLLTGNAKSSYEKAVKAAIEQWGLTMPVDYFTVNPVAAYDGTLECIMLQKYLALYLTDYQQWFEYRRTGLPELPTADGMLNGKVMPVRYKYPPLVQVLNNDNYKKALQAMGGDDNINNKVWWEK